MRGTGGGLFTLLVYDPNCISHRIIAPQTPIQAIAFCISNLSRVC